MTKQKIFTAQESLDHGERMYTIGREGILKELDVYSWRESPSIRKFVVDFINRVNDEDVEKLARRIKNI